MGRGAEWKCARVRAVLGTDRKIREDPHWWPEEDFNSENNISVRHKFGFATARQWVSILGIRGEIWGGAELCAIVSALPQAHTMFTAASITSRFVEFGNSLYFSFQGSASRDPTWAHRPPIRAHRHQRQTLLHVQPSNRRKEPCLLRKERVTP